MELKELIVNIEKRPQMYINDTNIHILSSFINGFLVGKTELSSKDEAFMRDFNAWILNYYDAPLQRDWSNIIYYYEGNHNKAIECFLIFIKDGMRVWKLRKTDDGVR